MHLQKFLEIKAKMALPNKHDLKVAILTLLWFKNQLKELPTFQKIGTRQKIVQSPVNELQNSYHTYVECSEQNAISDATPPIWE